MQDYSNDTIGKTIKRVKKAGGRRCSNCIEWTDSRVGSKKYDGFCATCFKQRFPDDPRSKVKYAHTKEIRVRQAINEQFEGFIHDTPLYTGQCDCSMRRRIDHRKLIGSTLLCIETDEFGHRGYDPVDEEIRYHDLYMVHSGKWVFIRFNPDGKGVDMEDKLDRLIEEIRNQIHRIENEENTDLLEIVELFYGDTFYKVRSLIWARNTTYGENLLLSEVPSEELFIRDTIAFRDWTCGTLLAAYQEFCKAGNLLPKGKIHLMRSLKELRQRGVISARLVHGARIYSMKKQDTSIENISSQRSNGEGDPITPPYVDSSASSEVLFISNMSTFTDWNCNTLLGAYQEFCKKNRLPLKSKIHIMRCLGQLRRQGLLSARLLRGNRLYSKDESMRVSVL